MSYPETLKVLAALHLDARFRTIFLTDPATAVEPLALTPDERECLLRLDPRTVERAGRLMDFHRVTRVQEQLPWVDDRARPDLRSVLADFMACTKPALLNREEALSFCRYLEASPRGLPAYVPELARCERLRIALAWELEPCEGGFRVETFQYAVLELRAALERAGWPASSPCLTRVRFTKVPSLPAVIVRTVPVGAAGNPPL